jgi:hypothetical protein
MDLLKVLDKIPQSGPLLLSNSIYISSVPTFEEITVVELFNILVDSHFSINTIVLHLANTALNDLVYSKQPLYTLARKFITYLVSTIEWLLVENTILKLELKLSKDMLGARKAREGRKWLVLK